MSKRIRALDSTLADVAAGQRKLEAALDGIKGATLTAARQQRRDPDVAEAMAEAKKWRAIAEEALGGAVVDLGPAPPTAPAPPATASGTFKSGQPIPKR